MITMTPWMKATKSEGLALGKSKEIVAWIIVVAFHRD
jgi:hypothetical protein